MCSENHTIGCKDGFRDAMDRKALHDPSEVFGLRWMYVCKGLSATVLVAMVKSSLSVTAEKAQCKCKVATVHMVQTRSRPGPA